MLKIMIVLANLLFSISSAYSDEDIHVHTYTNSKGFTFRNFQFTLTPENTVLPYDDRVKKIGYSYNASNYRYKIFYEKSINYTNYGQFEIFIPQEKFPLKHKASSFIIARMPQTDSGTLKAREKIIEKQKLYERIVSMIKNKKGSVEVVFEFPHQNSEEIGANIYFRTYKGQYIGRVGRL